MTLFISSVILTVICLVGYHFVYKKSDYHGDMDMNPFFDQLLEQRKEQRRVRADVILARLDEERQDRNRRRQRESIMNFIKEHADQEGMEFWANKFGINIKEYTGDGKKSRIIKVGTPFDTLSIRKKKEDFLTEEDMEII